jgi:hypothetical protein
MEEKLIIKQASPRVSVHRRRSVVQKDYKESNFLSRLFFFWAFRVLKLANKTQLKYRHLGDLDKSNKSENFSKKTRDLWYHGGYKDIKNYALLKTTIKANLCI